MSLNAQNRHSRVYLNEDGIFCIEWNPKVTLQVEDFQKVVAIYDEWSNGQDWCVLHIFPKGSSATSEARNFGAKREKRAKAEAFVIEGTIHRNLFRLYRRLRSVQYPMREFSSVEKAKEWLVQLNITEEKEI